MMTEAKDLENIH